ncbi:hypothetical protein WJT86_07925 [Microvirga sp. W0021]|uniref:Uncharacterized protein n=1 Tax=Hohaiivirga grylli TaxID=3133970 RepID=A0ABV0BJ43_9HYPH
MIKICSVALAALLVAGCSYYPSGVNTVKVVDTEASVKACALLGEINGPFATTPGDLWGLTAPMREKVYTMGGNMLLLKREGHDWGHARAYAYSCNHNGNDGW